MTPGGLPHGEACSRLLPHVLDALAALEVVGRRLHPPDIAALAESVREMAARVRTEVDVCRRSPLPAAAADADAHQHVLAAGEHLCRAFDLLEEAAGDTNAFIQAYRGIRASTQAVEDLYPLAQQAPEVSRFFTEPALRDDDGLSGQLAVRAATGEEAGVLHVQNDRESRGGFSIYVPEYYDPRVAYPLIVALHGGSGHGADFLWTWLREARSYGAILVAPTSPGRTWALQSPAADTAHIENLVEQVDHRWNLDRRRLLLTGMSDGGTFTFLAGLRPQSPFTHLAPSSASFHPALLGGSSRERVANLPVYLIHGALDWMFPLDVARLANATLSRFGAAVVFRPIDDLSHTYPRDENPRILQWFLS